MMQPDLWELYKRMLESRLFETEVTRLWNAGVISGEMHLGLGEEAIAAGIVCQLRDGDAMALDHRGTPPLLMRGVSPVSLMREFLGRSDGLCKGMGGHMHLFSPEHLAASSGIVGAAGPLAAGFALAAQHLRPQNTAVAFFGEGAFNQGMLMESMNLAVVWKLPVLFICKNNGWAISTRSPRVTGGKLVERAGSFGMPAWEIDGSDAAEVWAAAAKALEHARQGSGPSFIMARCTHPEGHFLGDPLIRATRKPIREIGKMAGPLIKSVLKPKGETRGQRIKRMSAITSLITKTAKESKSKWKKNDPLKKTRQALEEDPVRLARLEIETADYIRLSVETALSEEENSGGRQ